MADTFVDYLEKYGDTPFITMPFNDVDVAILSRFCYLKFDGLVPSCEENLPAVALSTIVLREGAVDKLCEHPKKEREKLNHRQVELMLSGVRFHDLRLNCFVNQVDLESQTQFSAICMFLPGRFMFVGFRGTDDTIVGWKEDMNMLFMDQVTGQKLSVAYLNQVLDRYDTWHPYVGGHSKGGNLAVYSFMYMSKEKQDRIRHVYSMDGPSFRQKILEECNYEALKPKITKIMPASSLVGMLLETDTHYQVVRSNGSGLAQHNVHMWVVEDNHFVPEEGLRSRAIMLEKTINGWIESQDDENRQKFIDNLYNVAAACDASTVYEFSDGLSHMSQFVTGIQDLDEETKNQLMNVVRALGEVAGGEFKLGMQGETEKLQETGIRWKETGNKLRETGNIKFKEGMQLLKESGLRRRESEEKVVETIQNDQQNDD